MSVKKNRTTNCQFEVLIDYLEKNKELLQSKSFKQHAEKWKKLRDVLNFIGKGPAKSVKEWKRVLIEWKYNTKRKARNQFSNKNKNGKPLNDIENRLLSLLKEKPMETLESMELPFVQILVEGNYDDKMLNDFISQRKNKEEHDQNLSAILDKSQTNTFEDPSNSVLKMALMQNIETPKTDPLSTTDSVIEACEPTANIKNEMNCNRARNTKKKNIQANKLMTLRNKYGRFTVSKIKSLMVLAEANFKLADSNLKVAESNCKIAASNEKLAVALQFYAETKLKELENNNN